MLTLIKMPFQIVAVCIWSVCYLVEILAGVALETARDDTG